MRDQFRPLLAALLAMALPGLGHVVLRRWGRALLWHLTIVGGGVALFALYDVPVGSTISPVEAAETAATLPTDVTLPIAILYALSAVDAYLVGRADVTERRRANAAAEAIRRRAASDDGDEIDDPLARIRHTRRWPLPEASPGTPIGRRKSSAPTAVKRPTPTSTSVTGVPSRSRGPTRSEPGRMRCRRPRSIHDSSSTSVRVVSHT